MPAPTNTWNGTVVPLGSDRVADHGAEPDADGQEEERRFEEFDRNSGAGPARRGRCARTMWRKAADECPRARSGPQRAAGRHGTGDGQDANRRVKVRMPATRPAASRAVRKPMWASTPPTPSAAHGRWWRRGRARRRATAGEPDQRLQRRWQLVDREERAREQEERQHEQANDEAEVAASSWVAA